MEPRPIICVIMLLTGGLRHTQTCHPAQKQPRTGTQYELIILTWPVWRNLRDLRNFKHIWSRWRPFQDVWEKTETRTTMKGNCMSLDCKWLVCSSWGWGVEWWSGVKIVHQYVRVTSVTGCRHHQTDPQNLRKENRKTAWIPLQLDTHL